MRDVMHVEVKKRQLQDIMRFCASGTTLDHLSVNEKQGVYKHERKQSNLNIPVDFQNRDITVNLYIK